MTKQFNVRLTVIGSSRLVRSFQNSKWQRLFRARYVELLENSSGRLACQFETETALLEPLNRLSRRWPRLTLLADYESEGSRIKGLVKAQAGKLNHCEISY